MSAKTPTRDEFMIEGDRVTHSPTGQCYRAEPASAEIVSENTVETGEYEPRDIRAMAKELLAERVRIAERLR
jgi:hypothetical protein